MCGIIGVINASTVASSSVVNFIKQGLVASQLRGTDSTGILQVGPLPSDVYVHRMATNSTEFVEDLTSLSVLDDVDSCAINVAHVRARTQGAVSVNNAHPFTVAKEGENRLIGVHNGSLVNWKTKKDGNKFDVDSHWAMHHIAQNGIKAFEDIQGPFAMVWWEEDDRQRVRIARNDQRPLHIMFNKTGSRMIFASEARMLAWIAERSGFDHDGKVRTIPTGKLFIFDTSGPIITWETEDLPQAKYTPYSYQGSSGIPGGTVPVPQGYRVFAEQLALVMAGKPTTEDATLRYQLRASNWTGSTCDLDFSEDDYLPPFLGGGAEDTGDYRFSDMDIVPADLMPSARHTKVTDDEVEEAARVEVLGAYIIAEAETYSPGNRILYGCTSIDGREYDVVFRNIGKSAGRRLAGDASIMDGVVVGVERDGTLIMSQTTKRIRDFLYT